LGGPTCGLPRNGIEVVFGVHSGKKERGPLGVGTGENQTRSGDEEKWEKAREVKVRIKINRQPSERRRRICPRGQIDEERSTTRITGLTREREENNKHVRKGVKRLQVGGWIAGAYEVSSAKSVQTLLFGHGTSGHRKRGGGREGGTSPVSWGRN